MRKQELLEAMRKRDPSWKLITILPANASLTIDKLRNVLSTLININLVWLEDSPLWQKLNKFDRQVLYENSWCKVLLVNLEAIIRHCKMPIAASNQILELISHHFPIHFPIHQQLGSLLGLQDRPSLV